MGVIMLGSHQCLVDDILIPILSSFTWHATAGGYAASNMRDKRILMHRFIMGAKEHDIVDHINGNKLDNTTANLRFVTKSQNSQNTTKKKLPTSGFIGVSFDKGSIKASIKVNGRKKHLGVFGSTIEAARAYDKAALKIYGPDARTNVTHLEHILRLLKDG